MPILKRYWGPTYLEEFAPQEQKRRGEEKLSSNAVQAIDQTKKRKGLWFACLLFLQKLKPGK